jgi:predicted RNA binding protein YcfA (HicA-like mRNA interferase family)
MKIPRNISGGQLAKLLEVYGYKVTRQIGSHIRLTTQKNGEHHITIPLHKAIHIGTLNNILKAISDHLEIDKETLVDELFSAR